MKIILYVVTIGCCLAGSAVALRGQERTPADAAATVIEAIRELDPQTPAEQLRAVQTLLNLRQADTAAAYLEKIIAQNPDEPTMISLYREFGPAFFIRLAREPALGDAAAPFARKVLETQRQAATNPARIRSLVEQLQNSQPEIRSAAVSGLRDAGSAAVAELLPVLAASYGSDTQRYLEWGMRQLGGNASGPLLGALQAPDPELRAAAMRSLGQLDAEQSIPFLMRPAVDPGEESAVRSAAAAALSELLGRSPDIEQATRYLSTTAQQWFRDGLPRNLTSGGDGDGMITVWSWDDAAQAPKSGKLPPLAASARHAAWLAADLYRLRPDELEYERLFIATQLAAGKLLGGLNVPLATSQPALFQRLTQLPASQFEAVLDWELRHNEAAAMGAAEMLGEVATAAILSAGGGAHRPLALALRHVDPRVRFAAVEAIVKIDPREPYPGAADFVRQLAFFARTEGKRRILVVHPRATEAETLAGMARSWGFAADAVGTGQSALKRALRSPDYEVILISDAVPLWTELLQQLRRDPRTGRIAVGLIVRSPAMVRGEQLARRDPLTIAYPLPRDPDTLGMVVQRALNQATISRTSPETRLTLGRRALGWLADLVAQRRSYPFYETLDREGVLTAALTVPELAERAALALGAAGTPAAQTALVDLASQISQPLALRRTAAAAFDTAVRRQGVQLTSAQILTQYERYNASEKLAADTQQVLASILDSIEGSTQRTSVFENN